ncbi:MAG TPA: M20/M25/M40 family metallo-hydrolase [Caulobacteraceae bacterium]|nr:M20/M25/M40 family metallo-hydrolase [Caulobacteraceae bacterium]
MTKFSMLAVALALPLVAAPIAAPAEGPDPRLRSIAGSVNPENLKATITRLVAFGTRHTLSDTVSETRGIGAARRWAKGRFEAIGGLCGGCLEVVTPDHTVTGERVPKQTVVQDVIAIQRGTTDPGRVVIISAHIDSRISDILDSTHDAPGANDDASGVAAVLEAARILSAHRFPATIVYAIDSGEEQGLYGGQVLADYAKAQGWRVEAVLNNDIIGGTHGLDGRVVDGEVRVFSEGTRADETAAEAVDRRRSGAELDSPSREIARFVRGVEEAYLPSFRVRMILRQDRFGRGGDQLPMQQAGYPAVRITEADENYTRQHQDVRTENGIAYGDVISGVDFPYLAKVTALNTLALAALASAPPPPTDVKLTGQVSADTTLSWAPAPGASDYRVWWRETPDPVWRDDQSRATTGAVTITLKGINIDDYVFGVSSRGPDGAESPVEFPGPAGAFFRK